MFHELNTRVPAGVLLFVLLFAVAGIENGRAQESSPLPVAEARAPVTNLLQLNQLLNRHERMAADVVSCEKRMMKKPGTPQRCFLQTNGSSAKVGTPGKAYLL
jgi:hypothetical protein